MSMQWKQSVISIKDKQTIISHLEKSEKGTNLALKFKISKQEISDICKNKIGLATSWLYVIAH